MSSWYSHLSDAIKRRVGRYLINRYLGPYLEEGILLDQLSVASGPVKLEHVSLNTSNINAILEDTEVPVELMDGYIGQLSVSVPWSNLLKDNCQFLIDGLTITLQVKKRANPAQISASIFHSMCESFSSINLAEDCLKTAEDKKASVPIPVDEDDEKSMAGVKLLAEAIDSIVMRVQVQLTNLVLRLEYVPSAEPRGLALELKIGSIRYAGEIPTEGAPTTDTYITSTLKKICVEGVQLFTDEFRFGRRISPACSGKSSVVSDDEDEDDRAGFKDGSDPLQIASLTGKQELVVRFSDTNQFGLPRSLEEVELNLAGVCLHIFPHQIHTLTEIFNAVSVMTLPAEQFGPSLIDNEVQGCKDPSKDPELSSKIERLLQNEMMTMRAGIDPATGRMGNS